MGLRHLWMRQLHGVGRDVLSRGVAFADQVAMVQFRCGTPASSSNVLSQLEWSHFRVAMNSTGLLKSPTVGNRSPRLEPNGRTDASKTRRQPEACRGYSWRWIWICIACLLHIWPTAMAQTQLPMTNSAPAFRVLVFSRTTGYRHDAIATATSTVKTLGALNDFAVTATENPAVFTDVDLAPFRVIVFLLTTGDVLNTDQQGAMERFIRAGKGFVGVHSTTDTEHDWPWFGGLVGTSFLSHPAQSSGRLVVEDSANPSTTFLPPTWTRTDEWFNFTTNPRTSVQVLLSLDESSYSGGTMGDHPIAWCHDYDGGRAWYTGLGHNASAYNEPFFRLHLLGGIQYAAGAQMHAPAHARALFDGSNQTEWVKSGTTTPAGWTLAGGTLEAKTSVGSIETVETYQDFRLHAEFSLPSYAPGTAEGQLNNSGIYLQRRYELQIMNTYGRAVSGLNETGAFWGLKDPTVNASVPDGKWETFDILFRAARWAGTSKTENARVTVYWNTVLVQDNYALTKSTGGGDPEAATPGPILLQGLVGPVRFRNIWVQGTIANPPTLAFARTGSDLVLSWPVVPSGFNVESTDGIGFGAGTTQWETPQLRPSTVGLRNYLQIPAPPANSFFRLSRPD